MSVINADRHLASIGFLGAYEFPSNDVNLTILGSNRLSTSYMWKRSGIAKS